MTRPPSPAGERTADPPRIELRARGDFVDWLAAAAGGTLAVTTYNSGKLALFSAPGGQLTAALFKLPRPMGLAFDGSRLAVAVREQILVYGRPHEATASTTPKPLLLDATHDTGRLDIHEMAFDARGLCFAATRFNCIARPSDRARFRRSWTPPFVASRPPRDCCHLNGLGIAGGRVAMVTAFCASGEPGGWRSADRFASGVVVDIRENAVAVRGLCMPHSPRRHGGQWWLCNSGEGALCTFDPRTGRVETVAVLPGFTRGLTFAGGRAVVGMSWIRKEHILDAPPIRQRFPRMRSGVWLVDVGAGRVTGALEFVRGGREVFDVAVLPGVVKIAADAGRGPQAMGPFA